MTAVSIYKFARAHTRVRARNELEGVWDVAPSSSRGDDGNM